MGCSSSSDGKRSINVVNPDGTKLSTIKSDSQNMELEKQPTSSRDKNGNKGKLKDGNRVVADTKVSLALICIASNL